MKKERNLDLDHVVKETFKVEYPVPEYYDDNPENSSYFKVLIKEAETLRPTGNLYYEQSCFDVAIRIIASQFLMEDNCSSAETSIIEQSLNDNMKNLTASHLIEISNHLDLIPGMEWSSSKDYFYIVRDDFHEIFDFDTVTKIVTKFSTESIQGYLLQLKAFFLYKFDEEYWYKLYQVDKADYENEADYEYQTERIDYIVDSILS